MSNEQQDIENAFYSDGYKIGMSAVHPVIKQKLLFDSLKKMYDAVDDFIKMLSDYAIKQGKNIDCKKGCEWCCYQPVYALSYEMEYLNAFIKNNFDNKSQNEIKVRAEKKNNKLKNLSDTDLLNSKFPCPLLQNGACIAYEARPMACRIYLSTEVNTCLSFYKNPESKDSIPALLDLPLKAGQKMNEGFKAALKTGGLAATEFRIEELLLVPPVKLTGTIK